MNERTKQVYELLKGNICTECGNFANENLRKWFKDRWVNIGKKKKKMILITLL